MEKFFDTISEVVHYLSIIYPILYLLGYRYYSKAYKIFSIYLIGITLIQLTMRIVIKADLTETNLFMFVYYFVFQFIALSIFYKKLLNFKWVHYVTAAALVFFAFQYIRDPNMYFRYNPIGVIIGQGIIVIYSLLYFYKLLSEKGEFMIVNIGVFFYLLSSMLIFASGNLALNIELSENVPMILSQTNLLLYLIFQILIIIEWYRNYRLRPAQR